MIRWLLSMRCRALRSLVAGLLIPVALAVVWMGEGAGGAHLNSRRAQGMPFAGYPPTPPTIPNLALWASHALTAAAEHGAYINLYYNNPNGTWCGTPSHDEDFLSYQSYYDAGRAYYYLADYTGDSQWDTVAQHVSSWFSGYINGKSPPGSINIVFAWLTGLVADFTRHGTTASKTAVHNVAINGSFANDANNWIPYLTGDGSPGNPYYYNSNPPSPGWYQSLRIHRELAFVFRAWQLDEQLGYPAHTYKNQLREILYNLINDVVTERWQGNYDFDPQNSDPRCWAFSGCPNYAAIIPFLDGTDQIDALFLDFLLTGEPRFLPAATRLLDYFWTKGYNTLGANTSTPGSDPTVTLYISSGRATGLGANGSGPWDLSAFIAPYYAMLWFYTGQQKYLTYADTLFQYGVQHANISGGCNYAKQFNQNYVLSFYYKKWRSGKAVTLAELLGGPMSF